MCLQHTTKRLPSGVDRATCCSGNGAKARILISDAHSHHDNVFTSLCQLGSFTGSHVTRCYYSSTLGKKTVLLNSGLSGPDHSDASELNGWFVWLKWHFGTFAGFHFFTTQIDTEEWWWEGAVGWCTAQLRTNLWFLLTRRRYIWK